MEDDAGPPLQKWMNQGWGQCSIFADDEVAGGVKRLLVFTVMPLLNI